MIKRVHLSLISNCLYFLAIALVFLGCLDLLSLQGYLLSAACVFFAVSILLNGNFNISREIILFFLFSILYFVFLTINSKNFSLYNIVYFIALPITYSYSTYQQRNNAAMLKLSIIAPAFGLGLCAFISILYTLFFTGQDMSQGVIYYFWTGGTGARTGLQILLVPLVGTFFGYLVTFDKKNKLSVLLFFALSLYLVLTIYFSLEISNRAIFVVIMLLFVVLFIRGLLAIKQTKIKIALLFLFSIVCGLLFGVYIGIIPLPDFLANIPVISRFLSGGSNEARIELYLRFFELAPRYLFGGMDSELTYVHNFVLDIYTYAGIVPFLLFVVCLAFFFLDLSTFRLKTTERMKTAKFTLFVFLSVFLLGMFEPIATARPFVISYMGVFFAIASSLKTNNFVQQKFLGVKMRV